MEPEAVREVFRGRLIRVEVESWPHGDREIVRHPGACAVVPITPNGEVLLVRQLREPIREPTLEIPAGIIEAEDPATCAAREVREETGYRVAEVEPLGSIYTSPGFTDERIELFVARTGPQPEVGPETGMEVVRMALGEAIAAAREGRLTDAKTALALLLVASREPGGR